MKNGCLRESLSKKSDKNFLSNIFSRRELSTFPKALAIIERMNFVSKFTKVTATVKNCAIKKEPWMGKIFIIKESRKKNNQMCVGGFLVELSFSHIHVALCVLFPSEFFFCHCRLTWHIIKLYWIKGGKSFSKQSTEICWSFRIRLF